MYDKYDSDGKARSKYERKATQVSSQSAFGFNIVKVASISYL